MARIAKLYAWILANPRGSVPFRDFQRLMEAFGFELDRIKGSHHTYRHPALPRPFPVQPVRNMAKPYQIEQFIDMVETYGLQIEA